MPVHKPGRHPAFEPIGRLRANPFKAGKKGLMMPLNLTAMVDMFTVVVIFLLQNFSTSGDLLMSSEDITLPIAYETELLVERGPVVTLFENTVMIDGAEVTSLDEIDDADPGISELKDRLVAVREFEEELLERAGQTRDPTQPYDGHMIIQADSETDFELVRKTIFSVNEAGWTHIQFLVTGKQREGEEGTEAAVAG
jgi:biopolymer transport protein ExbD